MHPSCPFCFSLFAEKVSFRTQCPSCDRDLHCCLACRHYAKDKPHDCNIPNIEPVFDKERNNFCEEYSLKKIEKEEKKNSDNLLKEIPKPKGFDSLFKD